MSLWVYLNMPDAAVPVGSGIFVRDDGGVREVSIEEWNEMNPDREPIAVKREIGETSDTVFEWNITHNLTNMAQAAGIYEPLWHPEKCDPPITTAKQLIGPLSVGFEKLVTGREFFLQFNPKNGWGTYENLVEFVGRYINACEDWPDAIVSVSR